MKEIMSFTFHRSYADVLWRIKDPVAKGQFVEMLTRYAFMHEIPSEDAPNYDYFLLIRPIIDKGVERSESGTRGGTAPKHLKKGSLKASFKATSSADGSDKDMDKDVDKEEEEDLDRNPESLFDDFWAAYPRKDSKKSARKAFLRIMRDSDDPTALLDRILSAIASAKKSRQWEKDDGQFIPMPTSWLNQERWEDSGVSEDIDEPTEDERRQTLDDVATELLK